MTVLDIWDHISGTSDAAPYNSEFHQALVRLLDAYGLGRPIKILDLGGGAGNPAIALAQQGHEVTLVDSDPTFTAAAERRAQYAHTQITVNCVNWTEFLQSAVARGLKFDVVLFLGNALAYQDSWPDHPPRPSAVKDPLESTLQLCRNVLRPGGIIVIESPLEPPSNELRSYTRTVPAGAAANAAPSEDSLWIVECDHPQGVRRVDTIVRAQSKSVLPSVRGRVVFHGYLLTADRIAALAQTAGMVVDCTVTPPRPFFQVCVLQLP